MTQDAFFSMCSTYCFVVGEGKDNFDISHDAMLVHTLNIAFRRGQGR